MRLYDYMLKSIPLLLILTPIYAYNFQTAPVQLHWIILSALSFVLFFVFYRYEIINKYSKNLQKNINIIDEHVLISYSDRSGKITDASEALCRLTGYTKEELIGKNHKIFRHPETPKEVFEELWYTITRGETFKGEIKNLSKDGSICWIDATITPIINKKGDIEGYTAIRQDITDKKIAQELSITDKLTQTYNRLHLENIFDKETQRAKRYGDTYSVIIMDIDFFKPINDNYGHDVGDQILIDIVKVLKSNIREIDVLGRWGGEEFLIICSNTNIDEAFLVAEKLRITIEKYDFYVVGKITCSFGVSEYRQGDAHSDVAVKRADDALYTSKDAGRNLVTSKD
ncbi:diguanylate cyclase [Sulfurimonas sp.]|uniref:sensor domain-containing diguanylate cyclase n=1 Tax=Sulfurimonas sp. TaxID=2022749 RepID=UPI0035680DE3